MSENRFNVLEYLFYRTTLLYSKIESRAGIEGNMMTGAWVVSVCLSLNFLSGSLIILYLGGDSVREFSLNYPKVIPIFIVGIGVIILVLSLYMFVYRHHKRIFAKYEDETKLQQKTRTRFAILYIVMSFVVLITIGVIGREFILPSQGVLL